MRMSAATLVAIAMVSAIFITVAPVGGEPVQGRSWTVVRTAGPPMVDAVTDSITPATNIEWLAVVENSGLAMVRLVVTSEDGTTVRTEQLSFGGNRVSTISSQAVMMGAGATYTFTFIPFGQVGKSATITEFTEAVGAPENQPPTASFTFTPASPLVGDSVGFDASASDDPDGTIVSYSWDFGDGSAPVTESDAMTEHAYDAAGTYTVSLTTTDDDGATGAASEEVTVSEPGVNQPPTASFTFTPASPLVGDTVAFDGSGSSDSDGTIASYMWDFGDGSDPVTESDAMTEHVYDAAGTYTVTLTVTDDEGATGTDSMDLTVQAQAFGIDYTFSDFFNVPWGEWWDYRFATYGDLPINSDCFNATSIADGVCTPSNPNIPDVAEYPYTNWYPLPGNLNWNSAANNPMVYAPYRFTATGAAVPGYDRSEPVFLPVLNTGEVAGDRLDFTWRMQYLDKATGDSLTSAGCPGVDPTTYDGFHIRSQISLVMDLQESKRIFDVAATDAESARNWWGTNTNAACGTMGAAETEVRDWFLAMGGGSAATPGKYDIANSFEWFYTNWYLDMTATVDDDGTTHVSIDHAAWGTEVLLARMFYWGSVSYLENHLDSTQAAGWWGMELAWFEDLDFRGSLGAPGAGFSFTLNSAMQYHFQHLSAPGANGLLDGTDDVPYWSWGPVLTDYTNDYFSRHPASELDRYPEAGYVHSTPGSSPYGTSMAYDFAPISWDLEAGESWHFQFPTGDVVFYDPNLTPVPANPQGGFVEIHMPIERLPAPNDGNPSGYGTWDGVAKTWDVVGPSSTGGPAGTPGADGIPGTGDDEYALTPWGSIYFGVAVARSVSTELVGSSGWPEDYFVLGADPVLTLFGKVANRGNAPVRALVEFKIYDANGGSSGPSGRPPR